MCIRDSLWISVDGGQYQKIEAFCYGGVVMNAGYTYDFVDMDAHRGREVRLRATGDVQLGKVELSLREYVMVD